ncbi:hypothetical protein CBR_g9100 [Chara braunii]|uniref:Uncharacterized protein n=1 Tax=Chara braunii TaxID=69332 RepID=A0A388KNS6_CHABU|nr:hypothetical protein CBR_g9100 [Chara braunii]|eukprot:GBG71687.1 hypothetical protein CBR_g9100 [Chara braunii]
MDIPSLPNENKPPKQQREEQREKRRSLLESAYKPLVSEHIINRENQTIEQMTKVAVERRRSRELGKENRGKKHAAKEEIKLGGEKKQGAVNSAATGRIGRPRTAKASEKNRKKTAARRAPTKPKTASYSRKWLSTGMNSRVLTVESSLAHINREMKTMDNFMHRSQQRMYTAEEKLRKLEMKVLFDRYGQSTSFSEHSGTEKPALPDRVIRIEHHNPNTRRSAEHHNPNTRRSTGKRFSADQLVSPHRGRLTGKRLSADQPVSPHRGRSTGKRFSADQTVSPHRASPPEHHSSSDSGDSTAPRGRSLTHSLSTGKIRNRTFSVDMHPKLSRKKRKPATTEKMVQTSRSSFDESSQPHENELVRHTTRSSLRSQKSEPVIHTVRSGFLVVVDDNQIPQYGDHEERDHLFINKSLFYLLKNGSRMHGGVPLTRTQ